MAKEKKEKKKEIVLTPAERFAQLLTLKEATKCILGIEDKYKIYVRLTKEFAEFGKTEGAKTVEGAEECEALSEECRRMAEQLDKKRPQNVEEDSQTVTTTVRQREEFNDDGSEKKKGKGKWIALGVLIFAVLAVVVYKVPATRYMLGNAEKAMGLNELAMKSFSYTGNYQDSEERLKESTYDYAMSCKESEKYSRARRKFSNLADKGYKDSAKQELNVEKILLAKAKVKKRVIFGSEKWIVIDKNDTAICLAKETAINDVVYNEKPVEATWETCSLRKYLNNDFLEAEFTKEEQQAILDTDLTNLDNATYKTDGGKNTTDKIFIPDENTIKQYSDVLKKKLKTLRLRTPGRDQRSTTYISVLEEPIDYGFPSDKNGACIRPMLWVSYQ